MMICELVKCDVEFEPRTYHHKFCTSQHAKAAKDRRYYERNREAVIAQTKSYHEANPEIARRSMRNYLASDMGYAKHRAKSSRESAQRRNVVLDPEFTDLVMANLFLRASKCQHCAIELTLKQRRIDHKLAIVNGGRHIAANIQILCDDCHKIKTVLDSLAAWHARAALHKEACLWQ